MFILEVKPRDNVTGSYLAIFVQLTDGVGGALHSRKESARGFVI